MIKHGYSSADVSNPSVFCPNIRIKEERRACENAYFAETSWCGDRVAPEPLLLGNNIVLIVFLFEVCFAYSAGKKVLVTWAR